MKTSTLSRTEFLRSDKAEELRQDLVAMTESSLYNTRVFSLIEAGPEYFVEKHMKYMSEHLKMDHAQYVMNLKLMTKLTR